MKDAIIPFSVVGGVFAILIVIAGVWVYMSRAGAQTSDANATLQQMQQEQQAATTNTTTMDTTTGAGAKYEITPGLEAQDISEGTGTAVTSGQKVSVKYTGMLQDGTVFDSSDLHGGTPFTFTLGGGQVIKGWDLGVVGMKPGGVRMLTIAPELAYGNQAVGGVIPANATLIFKVEMIGPVQ